jgi:hypothetical protein
MGVCGLENENTWMSIRVALGIPSAFALHLTNSTSAFNARV